MSVRETSSNPPVDVQAELASRGITAAAVLDRLLEVLEFKKDIDLAKYLSVSKATVSTWRSRNKIPYDMILLAYLSRRIDLIYCLTGEKVGALSGYPAYHAGLELAGLVGELNRRYGSPDKWRLEAGRPSDSGDASGAPKGAQTVRNRDPEN